MGASSHAAQSSGLSISHSREGSPPSFPAGTQFDSQTALFLTKTKKDVCVTKNDMKDKNSVRIVAGL